MKAMLWASLLAAALGLGACENMSSSEKTGAAVGTAAGAGIGLIAGGSFGEVVGAGLVGGALGYVAGNVSE
jgi:hypothetical protein